MVHGSGGGGFRWLMIWGSGQVAHCPGGEVGWLMVWGSGLVRWLMVWGNGLAFMVWGGTRSTVHGPTLSPPPPPPRDKQL